MIYINQAGYRKSDIKEFRIEKQHSVEQEFQICRSETQEQIYTGRIKYNDDVDPATGFKLCTGEFSGFNQEGMFFIRIGDIESHPFLISDDVYNSVARDSLVSFYYQRCGIDLPKELTGIHSHNSCHSGEVRIHPQAEVSGSKNVRGGWHDAGDYGRYILPGAVALGFMLMGYERNPEHYQLDMKGFPDFLQEMRYELDWMLTMQHKEKGEFFGALHYMVNTKGYTWEEPHKDDDEQFLYGFSSRATASFCAVAAQASRIYRDADREFSNRLLQAARDGWCFLESKGCWPVEGFQRPDDTVTGGYSTYAGDNKDDYWDKAWAAVELFLTTGEARFQNYCETVFKGNRCVNGGFNWMDTSGFAELEYILADGGSRWISDSLNPDSVILDKLKSQFELRCRQWLRISRNQAFYTALDLDEYNWGSNGEVAVRGWCLTECTRLTGNSEYRQAGLNQLHYLIGFNGHNLSFLTGSGTKSCQNIHHAALDSAGIPPFPGLLAGGPNSDIKADYILKEIFTKDTPPGMCYVDHMESYASNENCILYNAPFVSLAFQFTK